MWHWLVGDEDAQPVILVDVMANVTQALLSVSVCCTIFTFASDVLIL